MLAEDATAERAKHRSESQKAFSVIAMSVSTSQLYLITSFEEPKEAWNALKKHFERETLANKLFLKKQYFQKEMREGNSIDMHLKEMKELADKLSSIGAPISKEDQVVTLLGSLPSSFSTVVTALETHVDDLTMHFVQLIHHERKLKAQESKSEVLHDSALVGAQKRKLKSGSFPSVGPVTRLDTFSDFVQNEKRSHSIGQRLLKTRLNRTVMVREHFQCLVKFPKMSGW